MRAAEYAVTAQEAEAHAGIIVPTREHWDAERALGWPGSNGSSCSTDTIFGVRIGATTAEWSTLPADVHDFWYRVLRRLRHDLSLSIWQSEPLRQRIDVQFRDLLYAKSSEAHFVLRFAFRRRAWWRYRIVRRWGELATRPNTNLEYYART